MSVAIISHIGGVFWLNRNSIKTRISPEHTTSLERLTDWAESECDSEFRYNFADNLLPAGEPTVNTAVLRPSKTLQNPPKSIIPFLLPLRKLIEDRNPDVCPAVIQRLCKWCDKPRLGPWNSRQSYCSRSCATTASNQARTKAQPKQPTSLTCGHCGDTFQRYITPSGSKSATGKVFCKSSCKHEYFSLHLK